jgi:hypothetical protein
VRRGKEANAWSKFTREDAPIKMSDFRTWGCPVYVLDKRIQDGTHIGRWIERARQCVYVGHSLDHAGNVYLVWDPQTKHISPQYHLVFDENFTTVSRGNKTEEEIAAAVEKLFQNADNHWNYHDEFAEEHYYFNKELWSKPKTNKDKQGKADNKPARGQKRDRSGQERPNDDTANNPAYDNQNEAETTTNHEGGTADPDVVRASFPKHAAAALAE